MSRYHEVYARWKNDPSAFWAEAAKDIDWVTPWTDVYARSRDSTGGSWGLNATPAGTPSTGM
jgi:hypothetical protein